MWNGSAFHHTLSISEILYTEKNSTKIFKFFLCVRQLDAAKQEKNI